MADISVAPVEYNITVGDSDFVVIFNGAVSNYEVTVQAVIATGGSGVSILNDLADVTITLPADNEVLAYDSGLGEFINQTPSEAGLAATVHVHTAAAVVDFDVEVANNTDVASNTAFRHSHANFTELEKVTVGDHDVLTNNPHGVDFDDLSAASSIDFTPQVTPPSRLEGRVFYDPDLQALTLYPGGTEVVHQLGHEILARVLNNTGSTITNGTIVKLNGNVGGKPTIIAADATAADADATAGVATEDIGAGTEGLVTTMGLVNELDTSSWAVGTILYLSETSGLFTSTVPDSPSHQVVVGQVVFQHATLGAIYIRITARGNEHGLDRFFNGSVLENFTTAITESVGVVSLGITRDGGGDLSIIFGAGLVIFTAPATVPLTAGTDDVPVLNYVFIPQSTNTLTANTTGFPAAEFVPVATVFVQSALSVDADGVYKHHRWRDHMANHVGHLNHINSWIRKQHATWESGGVSSLTINSGPTPDDIYFSSTAGTALQLHVNSFPAHDMAIGDPVFVPNHPTTAYTRVTNLNSLLTDSTGASLSGSRFSLVFIGVVSSDDALTVLCNLPSGSYGSDADAIADPDNLSDFSLPPEFRGTGILLARAVLRHQATGGGTWTLVELVDLRGNLIGSVSGGGGGGTGGGDEFSDAGFRVNNATDATKQLALDVSGVDTLTTRTLTIPNSDGTLLLAAFAQSLTNKTIDPLLNTIDGDVLDIDFSPAFGYAPGTAPAEVTLITQLTAHLYGIALALVTRGDIFGPGSAVDNAIARFNGTSGVAIQASLIIIDDAGNMTGMALVDGRDLAVDGAKLDGIEALADVTDAINVAAAGAVMDGDFGSNGRMQRTALGVYTTVDPIRSKTFTVLNPLDSDDMTMFFMDRDITVVQVQAARRGGTDIQFVVYHSTSVGGTTNTLCTATTVSDGAGTSVTLSDATIPENSFLTYVQGTTTGTPTEITITVFFTED